MPELFFQHTWIGIPVWALLYISDYTLTLICARMYQNGVRDKIAFEGSYELTPYFQRDIDSLRVISPRFVVALATTSILLIIVWWLAQLSTPAIFLFAAWSFNLQPVVRAHSSHSKFFHVSRQPPRMPSAAELSILAHYRFGRLRSKCSRFQGYSSFCIFSPVAGSSSAE